MDDRTIGTDAAELAEQYGTTERLRTRSSFWAPSPAGESPHDIALAALADARSILEIGCGQGGFARRMQDELDAEVLATDRSPAMVEAAAARGVRAQVADADALPFADDAFDAVVAMWMLYHVPDLDRALAEVRRVLRPGGVLVAVTNGREHTADLRAAVGLGPAVTQFMAEDGAEALARHFATVSRVLTRGHADADHPTARAYVASFAPDLADRLVPYEGERRYTGSGAVFVAR